MYGIGASSRPEVGFDTTTPVIGKGDLLVIDCGATALEMNVIRRARAAGARACIPGAHPENEHGKLADLTALVPGQIFGTGRELRSVQPMASLPEQSLFLFEDIVAMLLIEKRKASMKELRARHTSPEGIGAELA
jgi:6-phospho-3-hexuloisomerase